MLDPSNTPIESDASTTELDDEVPRVRDMRCTAPPSMRAYLRAALRPAPPVPSRRSLPVCIHFHPSSVLCRPRAESLPVKRQRCSGGNCRDCESGRDLLVVRDGGRDLDPETCARRVAREVGNPPTGGTGDCWRADNIDAL